LPPPLPLCLCRGQLLVTLGFLSFFGDSGVTGSGFFFFPPQPFFCMPYHPTVFCPFLRPGRLFFVCSWTPLDPFFPSFEPCVISAATSVPVECNQDPPNGWLLQLISSLLHPLSFFPQATLDPIISFILFSPTYGLESGRLTWRRFPIFLQLQTYNFFFPLLRLDSKTSLA